LFVRGDLAVVEEAKLIELGISRMPEAARPVEEQIKSLWSYMAASPLM